MNYLAHAYFSYREPPTLVGNLISDFIKGKKQFDYPLDIQKGIRLHRLIDSYTDAHLAIQEAKKVFRKDYRLYAGAFVDVSFDYFIANDSQFFADEDELASFANFAYNALDTYASWIPEIAKGYMLKMVEQNWLFHYRSFWGIEKSFGGVVYRSLHLSDSATAFLLFQTNLKYLEACYNAFKTDLIKMVAEQ